MNNFTDKFGKRKIFLFLFLFCFFAYSASNEDLVDRADFFDAAGNHLMFVKFKYDKDGKNVERDVYMSDSTFKRRTVLVNKSSGEREKEVSFDFNNDTSFITTFGKDGDNTRFTVRDQFKVEQMGGDISYQKSGDDFNFIQNKQTINKMKYKKSGDKYTKIEVLDNSGNLVSYVELSYGGVGSKNKVVSHSSLMNVRQLGNNRLSLQLNLLKQSAVSCELMSLTGQKVATVMSGNVTAGNLQEQISLNTVIPGLANGVYLISVSVDEKRVYRDKILITSIGKGF